MSVEGRVIEELLTRTGHAGKDRKEKPMWSDSMQKKGDVTDTSGPSAIGSLASTDIPKQGNAARPTMDDTQNERIRMPTVDDVAVEGSSSRGRTRMAESVAVAGEAPSGDDEMGKGGARRRPEA